MKKTLKISLFALLILLACALMLTFTACDEASEPDEDEDENEETNAPQTEAHTHAFGEWETVKEATSSEKGIEERSCSCGEKETRELDMLPSLPTDEEKYNNALSLIAEEKYTEAYELLSEIKTYKPAKEKLKNFFYAPNTVTGNWQYSDGRSNSDSITYVYNSMGNIIETSNNEIFTYDSEGNILSGCDLIYGTYYTYTYKNGKLYKKTSNNDVTTYYYNSNGQISKSVMEDESGSEKTAYEYTYYTTGQVKTMLADGYKYSYDKNGVLTNVIEYEYDSENIATTLDFIYGEYGLTKINLNTAWGEIATFTYTYNQTGKLTKLEVKSYEEGVLNSTHMYTFADHQLCYSENPAVRERIAIVCYTDMEAALEIIW